MISLVEPQGPLLRSFGVLINKFPPDKQSHTPEDFVSLQFEANDGTMIPLFTSDMIQEVYDVYFTMKEKGIEATYQWLKNEIVPKKEEMDRRGTEEINSVIIFNAPILDDAKRQEKIAIALESDLGTLSDIRSCGKCGNEKTYFRVVQDRSADEGPSSVFSCPRCNMCWKEG